MTLAVMRMSAAPIEQLDAKIYTVPTEQPESDGTLEWDKTTMVLVQVRAGGRTGLGYSYTEAGAADIVRGNLAEKIKGQDALDVPGGWSRMIAAIRNFGDTGLGMMAVAAVDSALWDLKARLLDLPLATLLGKTRSAVPLYGSGGFTSYTVRQLQDQLGGWAADGFNKLKMKVGREPQADPERVRAAREAIGAGAELFVDANGAYDLPQALKMAQVFQGCDVTWFEEPVWHRNLTGLRAMRERAPAGMAISAGEYGFDLHYFLEMLNNEAVDVLQADATRCGITGFLHAATLCQARFMPMSSHCAPALHLHPCCAAAPVRHMEYFHDHVRIERMFFDELPEAHAGMLAPDLSRPGMGLELKEADIHNFEK